MSTNSNGKSRIEWEQGFQGAGNAEGFGMQIPHGGFEGSVPHGLLDGAGIDAAFQAMGGVAMTQLMGQNGKAQFLAGDFDGALEVGLVHAEADPEAGAGIRAGLMSGEEPGPGPVELEFGEFGGQLVGEHEGEAIVVVALPENAGKFDLLEQFGPEGRGDGNDAVLAALGAADAQGEGVEIEVLDAQVEGFADAQPATVEEAGDEIGGVAAVVGDGPQERVGLGGSGRVTETGEAFGAQGVDAVDGLVEHLLVEEEDGIESLVLSAGRDIPLASQVREEAFEFLAAGQIRGHLAQGIHIVAEPVSIHGFGGEAFVLTSQDLAQLLNGLVGMHMVFERAWSRGLDKYGPTR